MKHGMFAKGCQKGWFSLPGSGITKYTLKYGTTVQKLKRQLKNSVHLINANYILLNLVTAVCLYASRIKIFPWSLTTDQNSFWSLLNSCDSACCQRQKSGWKWPLSGPNGWDKITRKLVLKNHLPLIQNFPNQLMSSPVHEEFGRSVPIQLVFFYKAKQNNQ